MPHRYLTIWIKTHADWLRDVFHVTWPSGACFGVLTITDTKEMVAILMMLVTTACTVAVTLHKLSKPKNPTTKDHEND